jgi:hypothetical protein
MQKENDMDAEMVELMRVSKSEYESIRAQAVAHGFESIEDYVRSLLRENEALDDVEDEDDVDPVEAFREGWRDAMQGNYLPVDDIRRRVAEFREKLDE